MADKLELPQDPKLAAKIIDGEHIHQSRLLDMGYLGRFIGGGKEKPGNIAWFAIGLSFIFLGIVFVFGKDPDLNKQAVTLFGGVITAALGFLFGRSTS